MIIKEPKDKGNFLSIDENPHRDKLQYLIMKSINLQIMHKMNANKKPNSMIKNSIAIQKVEKNRFILYAKFQRETKTQRLIINYPTNLIY